LKRKQSLAAVFVALCTAAVALTALTGLAGASAKKASLTGAGSTFVAPLMAQWTANYSTADVNYSAVGSGAGIASISARTVDFGASDAPLTPAQFAGCKGCVQIPMAFSATSIPYNIDGVGYGLKLTGPILADIYLGKIKKWNSKRIRAINKGKILPNQDIVPIYRSDGSGTSYNFTDYLSHVSKQWKKQIGKGTQPAFPVGVGAKGSSGVAAKLGSTPGGVTYVDVAYSYKNRYKFAKVRNKAGKFILPTIKSIKAATTSVKKVAKNNAISVVDPSKKQRGAYPICTFVYMIVPLQTAKAPDLKPFVNWAVTKGQAYGLKPGLLFLPLPKVVQTAAKKTIARVHS
jgi:phosphate transport system substrate-binding protein